jgi:murein DD-endopeptidase MepM/ murein hydrolase activator NlpD
MRPLLVCLIAIAACEGGRLQTDRRTGGPADSLPAAAGADSLAQADSSGLRDSASLRDSLNPSLLSDSGAARVRSDSLPPLKRLEDTVGYLRATSDSVAISMYPDSAVRGGVLVARVSGANVGPRCTWKGEQLPCYRAGSDVRAIVPLPADEPPGEFELTVERSGGQPVRQTITVHDREFDRQLVFLDAARFALLRRGSDIARDARALRQVLAGESPQQRWSGGWRHPGGNVRATGYGVERFYFRASDSSRVVSAGSTMRVTGRFGVDTTSLRPDGNPAWRHSGVDIALARRTPVRAAASGTVADVGDYVLTGRTVAVDHGQGVHTVYFHLDSALVRRGDVVTRGAILGRIGETGLTTGPHLHYGVYVHGEDVDPRVWHGLRAEALR